MEPEHSDVEPAVPAEDLAEGGEPACLLARVCAECGAVLESESSARCDRCGSALDGT